MSFTQVVIFSSVLFVVLAYLLYTPLPDAIEEPWLYRTAGVLSSLFHSLSLVTSKLTGWSSVALYRDILSWCIPKIYENFPELMVEDLRFEGVPVRVYKLKNVNVPSPCVILMHGGGWVLHNIDTYDATSVQLALKTGIVVVSVEYRLAPENPHPAPIDDCLKVTKYILQNGHRLDIDANRVAVIGDEAGGTLATAVALRLAEEDPTVIPPLKLQVLIYPVTQVLSVRTTSYLMYKNYPLQNQRWMAFCIASYLLHDSSYKVLNAIESNYHITSFIRRPIYSNYFKEEFVPDFVRPSPEKEIVNPFDDTSDEDVAQKLDSVAPDPLVSPVMAENLAKLPPTYIIISEFDVLRDDGLFYVYHLREAGVKVNLSFIDNLPHGFMFLTPSPAFRYQGATKEWEKIYHYLNENL